MPREPWMAVAAMYRMYGMPREPWMAVAQMYRMYGMPSLPAAAGLDLPARAEEHLLH